MTYFDPEHNEGYHIGCGGPVDRHVHRGARDGRYGPPIEPDEVTLRCRTCREELSDDQITADSDFAEDPCGWVESALKENGWNRVTHLGHVFNFQERRNAPAAAVTVRDEMVAVEITVSIPIEQAPKRLDWITDALEVLEKGDQSAKFRQALERIVNMPTDPESAITDLQEQVFGLEDPEGEASSHG